MNGPPSVENWPETDLEQVPECPVCGCRQRTLVHTGLTDVTFFTAAGRWNLWRCESCGSGWLDPRPAEDSIGRAYRSYYTHGEIEPAATARSGWRHYLGNGYRNWRFGANLKPASRLGVIAALFAPTLRRTIDATYRYLPNCRRSGSRRLLDYGCGNGAFQRPSGQIGWEYCGVEPDPLARRIACSTGADVRATLSDFERREMFDAITLSHVIEHVHRPRELLACLAQRLKVGGFLYIQTPNMDAIGHRLFGRHWRGLETPRHLVLFTPASLTKSLQDLEFHELRFHACPGAFEFTQLQSRRIASSCAPYDTMAQLTDTPPRRRDFREAARAGPNAEFITFTALKK